MGFPIITEEIQVKFEDYCKGIKPEKLPQICGYFGRACRRMNDKADRMLCINCPLKSFAEKMEDKL